MIKCWSNDAWEEFLYWQENDKQVFKRIIELIKDIDKNGYSGIGKPEKLKGDLANYYSRRIDKKNRIVYKIQDGKILTAQCGSHYKDK